MAVAEAQIAASVEGRGAEVLTPETGAFVEFVEFLTLPAYEYLELGGGG